MNEKETNKEEEKIISGKIEVLNNNKQYRKYLFGNM